MDYSVDKENEITVLAETNFRNRRERFGIKRKDRRGHLYIVGKTGMGKSTLLENLIFSDVQAGEGLAVIDPHGDLVEKVLGLIPERRQPEVISFNPADLEHPIGFNVLERSEPDHQHLIASGLISVFKKIWADSWGPRMEHILRNTVLALLELPGATLLDVPRMLVEKEFRAEVVAMLGDQSVKEFWLKEYERYPARFRTEAISPIQNKVGQFLSSRLIREIVGQKRSAFDLRQVMDEGRLLLVNLAKGKIGEDTSALLGAMLLTRIELAALSRADTPEEERRDFYLYVDEFHSFVTASFASILSESRKYRLNLILAHQYIEQLEEELRAAIFGNVGTIIAFRLGAPDAEVVAREFSPAFTEHDLINLPQHHICLKLMIDGVTHPAFSAVTLPPRRAES